MPEIYNLCYNNVRTTRYGQKGSAIDKKVGVIREKQKNGYCVNE